MFECTVCLVADEEVADYYDEGSPRHRGCHLDDHKLVLESVIRELRNLYMVANPIPAGRLKTLTRMLSGIEFPEPVPVSRLIRHFDQIAEGKRQVIAAGKGAAA